MQKLDFPEKLIQTGKRETTDALLKRLKVSIQPILAQSRLHSLVDSQSPSIHNAEHAMIRVGFAPEARCSRARFDRRQVTRLDPETTHQSAHSTSQRVSSSSLHQPYDGTWMSDAIVSS